MHTRPIPKRRLSDTFLPYFPNPAFRFYSTSHLVGPPRKALVPLKLRFDPGADVSGVGKFLLQTAPRSDLNLASTSPLAIIDSSDTEQHELRQPISLIHPLHIASWRGSPSVRHVTFFSSTASAARKRHPRVEVLRIIYTRAGVPPAQPVEQHKPLKRTVR